MQVTPDTLEAASEAPAVSRAAGEKEDELRMLKLRIELARQLKPQPHELHCRDCFNRGRDAAIRAITGQ